MNNRQDTYRYLFWASLGAAGFSAYLSIVLGQQKDNIYFYGFLAVPVLAVCAFVFYRKASYYKAIEYVRNEWGSPIERKRNFNEIKRYHSFAKDIGEKQFVIDDQTWEDLNMDKVYTLLDRTLSTPGEHLLHDILRKPKTDKMLLQGRRDIINLFQKDGELREDVQAHLFRLGRQLRSDVLGLLWEENEGKSSSVILYKVLAAAPIVILCSMPFLGVQVLSFIILSFIANLYIHYKSNAKIKGKVASIQYLGSVIEAAKRIGGIGNPLLKTYTNKLAETSKKCERISKKTSRVGSIEGIDMFADYVNVLFLAEERNYFGAIDEINACKADLQEMYGVLGELDALISIASYREDIQMYCEPKFSSVGRRLKLEKVVHPLIEEPVPNSVEINEGGIILTGSNMSGKSTFLRTLGVSALFAQTIYTCLAEEYEGSFFNIVTSISPSDNIMGGKSYYLGEAEALLRIIRSTSEEVPCLCVIDEIFRGTNPIERVSASAEILKYLMEHNALVIVATHDLELTEIVGKPYECYYFTEDVDDDGLKFDYLIKKGVSPTRNAIKLLKYIGYPEEIIENSNLRIEGLAKA